jgi:hypothetical protein
MIRQVHGSTRFFYLVRDATIEQYEAAEETQGATWDLPSPPRSPLLISSCNDAHWSIVCEHHLRTHDVSVPHAFELEKGTNVTFVNMHEIGVDALPPAGDRERVGIRLIHVEPPLPSDVCQVGDDVHVRHLTNNGFVQIIVRARLIAANVHGVLVHDGTALLAYDRFGLHPRHIVDCAADALPLSILLRPFVVLLANYPPGAWRLFGGRWHLSHYVKIAAALGFASVLLRLAFAF